MENAWEPMKNKNSLVVSGRLWKVVGTICHMLVMERKGPQPMDGWILDGMRRPAWCFLFFPTLFLHCFSFLIKQNAVSPFTARPADLRKTLNVSFYCWNNQCGIKVHFRYRSSADGRCSRSKTVGHHSCGQTPTKQEDHQEEEGRGGGSKGSQRRSAITEERYLRRDHSVREQR